MCKNLQDESRNWKRDLEDSTERMWSSGEKDAA